MEQIAARQKTERVVWFDILRIVASLAVMTLHISAACFTKAEVGTFDWAWLGFYDAISRWCVPVFVMISGSLFLEWDYTVGKMHKKHILRIVTAFVFWSAIYALDYYLQQPFWIMACLKFVGGHYHMWFLVMIIGLYLIVPFVRKITDSPSLTRYFLVLSFLFAVFIPWFNTAISGINIMVGSALSGLLEDMNFYFPLGYVFYFVLGYYLYHHELKGWQRILIYILSLIGFAHTVLGAASVSLSENSFFANCFDNLSPNVVLESIGVFVFFKYAFAKADISEKAVRIIVKISGYSFGAYLVHVLVLELLDRLFGLNAVSFSPVISTPVIGIIVFVISYVISFLLNQIPKANKYIV